MQRLTKVAVIAAILLAAAVPAAQAKINPNFTPVDLIKQSTMIVKVTLKPGAKPMLIEAEPIKDYRNGPKGKITIDLSMCPHKAKGEKIAKKVKDGEIPFAILFTGDFVQQGDNALQRMAAGYLHLAQYHWLSLAKTTNPAEMEMEDIDIEMEATWAGATDMLDRCVQYVLATEAAKQEAWVPSLSDTEWDGEGEKIGAVAGKVAGCTPVLMTNKGASLFIASDGGDKLFVYDDKEDVIQLIDVTEKVKLASKSKVFAWGDFDRNGKIDLASWDGKTLTLHMQQDDGSFAAKPADIGDALKDGCISLAVIDTGNNGVGLLAGTPKCPVVLTPAGAGKFAGKAVESPAEINPQNSEYAGQCLVADLDNDGIADIVQLFNANGMFFKGKGPGQFEKGQPSPICFGKGRGKGWFGDYDFDGLLDIFTVGEDQCRIWHNRGGGKFDQQIHNSGEVDYISKPDGIDGMTCDFNNDGRPDILIVYSNMRAQLFFNRGWRSTGHAHAPTDLGEKNLIIDAEQGQQGGCIADFNNDGAQDMIVICPNGDIYVLYQAVRDGAGLSLRVVLPTKSGPAGPINVVATGERLCLGAWPVTAGSTSAFFGLTGRGTLKIEWKTADGKAHSKQVKVDANQPPEVLDAEK